MNNAVPEDTLLTNAPNGWTLNKPGGMHYSENTGNGRIPGIYINIQKN